MARVFLDTNYFIGLANRAPEAETEILDEQKGFISTCDVFLTYDAQLLKLGFFGKTEVKSEL